MTDEAYISRFDIQRCNLNTWDANLRDIREIYVGFEALGIPTVNASRIGAYRDAFQSFSDAHQEQRKLDLSLAIRILNTMVEFRQLQTILRAATASQNRDMWRERLRQLISGAEFSTHESNTASPRDFQFESYIGAVCELSGYSVRFDEPDIVVTDNFQVFGIAAKRPRNERKLQANCKKAVRQIRNSGISGLIAIDLSFALQADQCINTIDLRGATLFVEEIANGFIRDNHTRLQDICRDKCVLGALIHVQMPVINFGHPDGPQLATAIRWTVAPFTESQVEGFFWATEFSRRCDLGLFGPRPPEDNQVDI